MGEGLKRAFRAARDSQRASNRQRELRQLRGVTEAEFNERTAAVFKRGMSERQFITAYIEALPPEMREKWNAKGSNTREIAKVFVAGQLESRFAELNR